MLIGLLTMWFVTRLPATRPEQLPEYHFIIAYQALFAVFMAAVLLLRIAKPQYAK